MAPSSFLPFVTNSNKATARRKAVPKRRRKATTKRCAPAAAAKKDSTAPLQTSPTNKDKIEKSPTGRAKCQACGKKIAQGSVRIGIEAKHPGRNFYYHQYYHDKCVAPVHKEMLRLDGGASPAAELAKKKQQEYDEKKLCLERLALGKSLHRLRGIFAKRLRRMAFMVFPNQTLRDLVIKMPTTSKELANVWGMGPKRIRVLGSPILEVIRAYRNTLASSNSTASLSAPKMTTQRRATTTTAPRQSTTTAAAAATAPATAGRPRRAAPAVAATRWQAVLYADDHDEQQTSNEVIDLVNDDEVPTPAPASRRSRAQPVTPTVAAAAAAVAATDDDDDDDEIEAVDALTIEEIVNRKFEHAQANGYLMELD